MQSSVEFLNYNVICDQCKMFSIKDYRYKCKICMNYDVCNKCINTMHKKHNEKHDFLAIPRSIHNYKKCVKIMKNIYHIIRNYKDTKLFTFILYIMLLYSVI